MLTWKKNFQTQTPPAEESPSLVAVRAEEALSHPIRCITDERAPLSGGGPHDYYSNGDYWWPNPQTKDGLPYIQRDGETNPGNFDVHRHILRQMRSDVCSLALGYRLDKEERYAQRAVKLLTAFFLDPETRMNPSLTYAQAIPGICPGRGIGIIDTLHLAELPFAIETLQDSPAMDSSTYQGLKDWFAQYLGWMLTSRNGIEEASATNNHSVCFFVQAAAFALFTDNLPVVEMCRHRFQTHLMAQMDSNGGFPRELARTKPYNYSIFVLDNMVTLCQILSSPEDDLWEFRNEKGLSIQDGINFLLPYLQDKSAWPYAKDVMHFDAFPVRSSFLLFAGCRLGREELLRLYRSLPDPFSPDEVSRNNAIQYPQLLL